MSDLTFNKVAGAVLATTLAIVGLRELSSGIFAHTAPAKAGYAIEVAGNCKKLFPVMDEIVGWRLLEGWTIDLVDATRKTRVRFSTPDERYVAIPEVDGIASLHKPSKKK